MAIAEKDTPGARIIVLGGGNGTSRVLTALVPFLREGAIASLHALIHMADDGGSSGRLREQYDVGSMGDVTRCMLALSDLRGDVRGEEFLRALEYRFSNGDFKGHTLRNALLAALELTSDLDTAIATFARVLQIPKYAGVVPTTLSPLTQQVSIDEDVVGTGQHYISWNVDLQPAGTKPGDAIVSFADTDVELNPRALEALSDATHIIIAPGHTYGTILPTLASLKLYENLSGVLAGKNLIVVMPLLTTPKHTAGWSGEDFVRVYDSYLNRTPDVVIAHSGPVDVELVEGQELVSFVESDHSYELIQDSIGQTEQEKPKEGDVVPRAIAIHDAERIRGILKELLLQ